MQGVAERSGGDGALRCELQQGHARECERLLHPRENRAIQVEAAMLHEHRDFPGADGADAEQRGVFDRAPPVGR